MIPKYLYHYTTIETLKAIINSGNIRFNRLDKLNDPYEGIVKINDSYIEFRKNAFCSCWTPNEAENMLMWSMYTGKSMAGVRIKMNSCMFAKNFSSLIETGAGFYPKESIQPINYEGNHTQTGKPITINSVYGPIKIEYVDDVSEIYEKVTSSDYINKNFKEFSCGVDFKELGIRKLKYWNGENEWRYMVWPFSFIGKYKRGNLDNYEVKTHKEYIDVPYKKKIDEIILGPGITKTQKFELKNWLKSNNISIPLLDSCIKINTLSK